MHVIKYNVANWSYLFLTRPTHFNLLLQIRFDEVTISKNKIGAFFPCLERNYPVSLAVLQGKAVAHYLNCKKEKYMHLI